MEKGYTPEYHVKIAMEYVRLADVDGMRADRVGNVRAAIIHARASLTRALLLLPAAEDKDAA
jgi:hypothetical protein